MSEYAVIRYGARSLANGLVLELGTDRKTAEYLLDYAGAVGSVQHPWRLVPPLLERTEIVTDLQIGLWEDARPTDPSGASGRVDP